MEENVVNENVENDVVETAVESETVSEVETNAEETTANETETTEESVEPLASKPKQTPFFKRVGHNLYEMLSYVPPMVYLSISTIVTLLGLLFFINEEKAFITNEEVVTACNIMQVVFGTFLVLSVVFLFISSILNIIRVTKKR